MRLKPDSRWGAWVAALAAYLTAFQLVFAGLAPIGHAAEQAGQVICTHLRDGATETPDGSGRRDLPPHTPDCCLFGCAMPGGFVVPATTAALPAQTLGARHITLAEAAHAPDLRREHSPRVTRGPPGIV